MIRLTFGSNRSNYIDLDYSLKDYRKFQEYFKRILQKFSLIEILEFSKKLIAEEDGEVFEAYHDTEICKVIFRVGGGFIDLEKFILICESMLKNGGTLPKSKNIAISSGSDILITLNHFPLKTIDLSCSFKEYKWYQELLFRCVEKNGLIESLDYCKKVLEELSAGRIYPRMEKFDDLLICMMGVSLYKLIPIIESMVESQGKSPNPFVKNHKTAQKLENFIPVYLKYGFDDMQKHAAPLREYMKSSGKNCDAIESDCYRYLNSDRIEELDSFYKNKSIFKILALCRFYFTAPKTMPLSEDGKVYITLARDLKDADLKEFAIDRMQFECLYEFKIDYILDDLNKFLLHTLAGNDRKTFAFKPPLTSMSFETQCSLIHDRVEKLERYISLSELVFLYRYGKDTGKYVEGVEKGQAELVDSLMECFSAFRTEAIDHAVKTGNYTNEVNALDNYSAIIEEGYVILDEAYHTYDE